MPRTRNQLKADGVCHYENPRHSITSVTNAEPEETIAVTEPEETIAVTEPEETIAVTNAEPEETIAVTNAEPEETTSLEEAVVVLEEAAAILEADQEQSTKHHGETTSVTKDAVINAEPEATETDKDESEDEDEGSSDDSDESSSDEDSDSEGSLEDAKLTKKKIQSQSHFAQTKKILSKVYKYLKNPQDKESRRMREIFDKEMATRRSVAKEKDVPITVDNWKLLNSYYKAFVEYFGKRTLDVKSVLELMEDEEWLVKQRKAFFQKKATQLKIKEKREQRRFLREQNSKRKQNKRKFSPVKKSPQKRQKSKFSPVKKSPQKRQKSKFSPVKSPQKRQKSMFPIKSSRLFDDVENQQPIKPIPEKQLAQVKAHLNIISENWNGVTQERIIQDMNLIFRLTSTPM